MRSARSAPAVSRRVPVAPKATAITPAVWGSVRSHLPVATSHSRTVLSRLAEAT